MSFEQKDIDFQQLNSLYGSDINVQKEYKCSFCPKTFNQPTLFQKHLQIHLGVRTYICNVCKKGFNTKGNLKNHFRIHTGEKPFKCNACDHTSNHLSNLKKHIITRHGYHFLKSLPQ